MPLTATASALDVQDGVYPATVLSLVETPPSANSPKQENYFRWTLHIWHNDEGAEMIANSSMNFSPKAKTRIWVESILDRRFAAGELFHWETFAPKDCMVAVRRDENGFCKVESITGVPKRQVGRVAAPAPVSAPAPAPAPAAAPVINGVTV